jgi:hypothetical protein
MTASCVNHPGRASLLTITVESDELQGPEAKRRPLCHECALEFRLWWYGQQLHLSRAGSNGDGS